MVTWAVPASPQTLSNPVETVLETTPLFTHMRSATKAEMLQLGRVDHAPKGKILFMQDDRAEWSYVVISGWVKLFRETLEGEEVVLDIATTRGVLGESIFFTSKTYRMGAEVVEAGDIFIFPAQLIEHEITAHPPFAAALMRHMAIAQARRDKEIEHRTLQNAAQRLGCFLLRLCGPEAKGAVDLRLPYDKGLIASALGMKAETFSRALARLQKDLNLTVRGSEVRIERASDLVAYTCRSCSDVFPCEK